MCVLYVTMFPIDNQLVDIVVPRMLSLSVCGVCVSLRGLKGYRNSLGRLETKGLKKWERGRVVDTQREGCNKSTFSATSLSRGPDRFT